jgi:hypothetical protein
MTGEEKIVPEADPVIHDWRGHSVVGSWGNMERVIQKWGYHGDPTMRPRRARFTIQGHMITVLVVAVPLSMPIWHLKLLMVFTTILVIMYCFAYGLEIMIRRLPGHTHGGRRRSPGTGIVADPDAVLAFERGESRAVTGESGWNGQNSKG